MAYQTVPTVLTGDSWSAAQHNTYIRDNFTTLWPYTADGQIGLTTSATAMAAKTMAEILQTIGMIASQAAGDLFYGLTATTIGRLAKGTAYQRLQMNAGATAPEWAPSSQTSYVYRSSDLSISASIAETVIGFNAEVEDANWHSNTTNPSRVTPTVETRYISRASICIENGSGTNIDSITVQIKTSTGEYLGGQTIIGFVNGATVHLNVQGRTFNLSSGDYFTVVTYRSNVTAAGIVVKANLSWFEVERMR